MSANDCQVPGFISVRSLSAPGLEPGTRHIFSTTTPNPSSLHLRGHMDTFATFCWARNQDMITKCSLGCLKPRIAFVMRNVAAAVALEIAPKVSSFVLTQAKCTWIFHASTLCYAVRIRALSRFSQNAPSTYVSLATLFLSPSPTFVPSICLSFSLWLRHFILRFLAFIALTAFFKLLLQSFSPCCNLSALAAIFKLLLQCSILHSHNGL